MNDLPLVSSIVTFLNAERFIKEAIDSIVTQTYPNWEILLVDDGSTDNSTSIALEYVRLYPDRCRYLQHPGHQNRGTSASRNLGADNARGEYIAFLDADDVWLPETLSRQVAILEAHPTVAMVYGKCLFWNSWREPVGSTNDNYQIDYFVPLGALANSLLLPPHMLVPFLRDRTQQPIPSCMMVRHEVFTTIGGFEDGFRYHLEDRLFTLKILVAAPIFVADEQWVKYRQHDDSWCAVVQKDRSNFKAQQAYLDWVAKYLARCGIKDRQVWLALWLQKFRYGHPLFYYLSKPQEIAVRIGRIIFPKQLRHWLWVTFSDFKVIGTDSS
jgi:glycosyltransferase involved in cell wall biosynthesis